MSRRHFLIAAASLPVAVWAQSAPSSSPIGAAGSTPNPGAPRQRPPIDTPIGPTVADLPSPYYQFEKLRFDSRDGKRHYRVYVGIPRSPAPQEGYPVLYMLDGNAAMHTLKEADLEKLAQNNPPVLVGIGYDVPTRHDVVARAFDYTPPVLAEDGSPKSDVVDRSRPGGGAELFLDLIESTIRPAVAARTSIDASHQTLWGHSYGGLFTLYAMVTRPQLFQRYVAGDPSTGWGDNALLKKAAAFHAQQAPGISAQVLVGGGRAVTPSRDQPNAAANVPVATPPQGRESTHALVARLAAEGMDITFQAFPQQSHSQLFATSLYPALALAAKR
ncbi:alpha/beta hydrolase [Lampropedia puyangensis]|uniref:Alpha/beta hydrolase n=1 Tax=Lampropedia puyangensis TaxID=1330072 RepID=A0A4S8F7W7_9BURK|nr:alpha/beta hydrolase-fold protein [Lampropedia puyangensis]THU03698.1 alpha/beta hydrolase [Lampropedia puyangensis]